MWRTTAHLATVITIIALASGLPSKYGAYSNQKYGVEWRHDDNCRNTVGPRAIFEAALKFKCVFYNRPDLNFDIEMNITKNMRNRFEYYTKLYTLESILNVTFVPIPS